MLYLWMPEKQGIWLWQLNGEGWQSADSLEHLLQKVQAVYNGHQAVVFFPSQSAQFYTQQLTKRKFKQLGHVGVRYLIEEYVADPIENYALFYQFQHEQIDIMAINKQLRETYQHSLALLPWQIQALLPDFLIVPEPDLNTLHVLQAFDRGLLRWSKYRGWIKENIPILTKQISEIQQINLYQVDSKTTEEIQQVFPELPVHLLQDESQIELSRTHLHPFNALSKEKRLKKKGFNYLKAISFVLAAALITQLVYDGLRWWKYRSLAEHTAHLAVQQYQQWFPNESRVTEQNLHSLFKSKLQGNAFVEPQVLNLLSRVAPVLQQTNLHVQTINYQDNKLGLSIKANSSEALNKLTEQLKQQGFNAELGAIRNVDSQVVGSIKVQ